MEDTVVFIALVRYCLTSATVKTDDFMTTLAGGRFDLALAGWIADTTDPADFYDALLWSRSIGDENGSNNSRWNDPATDDALARFRVQPTEENASASKASSATKRR